MPTPNSGDSWSSGDAYERFMGRWSAQVAPRFLDWLAVRPGMDWLDAGCGTGNLSGRILDRWQPRRVIAVDSSRAFVAHARQSLGGSGVRFQVGLAQSIGLTPRAVDAVVSGLVLNFLPRPEAGIAEFIRVTRPGGVVGVYVWDYAEGMQMLRYFWDAAARVDPRAAEFDEGETFTVCQEGQLEALMKRAGLRDVQATAIETATVFVDFEDYWTPFLGKVGAAPVYLMRLDPPRVHKLASELRKILPTADDGSIRLTARAWAVQGVVAG